MSALEPQYDAQDMAIHDLATQNRVLKEQRDELLAALRELVDLYNGLRDMIGQTVKAKLDRADAAIAKAEGRTT